MLSRNAGQQRNPFERGWNYAAQVIKHHDAMIMKLITNGTG